MKRALDISILRRRSTLVIVLLIIVLVDLLLVTLLAYSMLSGHSVLQGQVSPTSSVAGDVPVEGVSTAQFSDAHVPAYDVTPTPVVYTTPIVSPIPPPTALPFFEGPIVYGRSCGGDDLIAYRLGSGPSARIIVGGIHGGYEWNTVDLVSQTLSYFQGRQEPIPSEVTLYIVPCANPDGYAAAFDLSGRVNADGVDLNRNWDYQWQMTATHGVRPVYAGEFPFSEPETAALRDFILNNNVELAIFYHSAMGKVFSGAERDNCFTYELAEMMAGATGYPHDPAGVPGQITTGDAIDWLSMQGIAGIEIELTNHQDIEWDRNLAGIRAFLEWKIPDAGPVTPPISANDDYSYITYTVQPGEVLSVIAERYGVSLEKLIYVNDIVEPDRINAGDVILIPVGTGSDDANE
jgi:LysM repeat protein